MSSTRWHKAAALPPNICAFGDSSAIVFGEADPPVGGPKAFAVAARFRRAKLVPMEIASRLRELVGPEIVANDADTLSAHSGDKWFAAHKPDAVVCAISRSTEPP